MPASPTLTRTLTAAVLVPVVLAIIFFAPHWAFAIGLTLVIIGAVREFLNLAERKGAGGYRNWVYFCSAGIVFSQYDSGRYTSHVISGVIDFPDPLFGIAIPFHFWLMVFIVGVAAISLRPSTEVSGTLSSAVVSAAALIFVAVPLSFLQLLRHSHFALILVVLVTVWIGDTAAYFAGRAFGKHRLAPTISPGKTWEGAIANAIASIGSTLTFAAIGERYWQGFLVLGIVISVAGQLGDLLESAFKRSVGVKDSGSILPGHGGILDRIDALVLAAPAAWYFSEMFLW